jgi:acyl-CoA thioester hydrolase
MPIRPPEVRLRLQLRHEDIDILGHLNNAVYHVFFHEARMALLDPIRAAGARFVLARTEIDYLREIRHADGHVEVTTRFGDVGRKSVTLLGELHRPDGTLAARGRTVVVAWDVERRSSRELTGRESAAFSGVAVSG